MRTFFTFLVLIGLLLPADAQEVYQTQTFNRKIKTVQLYLEGFELSGPYLDLHGGNTLALHFDELGFDVKNYQYTLIHCNSDWTQSSLLSLEYLDGYTEDYINNYSASFNSLQEYVHYSMNFPNANMRLKKSGNYILKVYEVGNYDSPSFLIRFVVYEKMASVTAQIKRSDIVSERENLQEIDFNVIPPFSIMNPFTDLKATILQNGRWDNAINNLPPTFTRENELVYNYDKKSSFSAGNEYRQLDLKTLRYQTGQVAKIIVAEGTNKVQLIADIPRAKFPYSSFQDINGAYVIRNQDGTGNPNTDADYTEVKFTLPYSEPLAYGSIYVTGDFNQNRVSEENQLHYNYTTQCYEGALQLKQGFYNYQYVVARDNGKPDASIVEGNFYPTENNYTIILYFRDFAADYDRVIACTTVNSVVRK